MTKTDEAVRRAQKSSKLKILEQICSQIAQQPPFPHRVERIAQAAYCSHVLKEGVVSQRQKKKRHIFGIHAHAQFISGGRGLGLLSK